ncbi:hypothetical protein ACN38_g6053 [Penicillium nordicum]|uniref:Uncharacterized protein n=1 Tax=Penicillium nordicum TaxID=229535 RepID=A0A0M9WFP3_9EURO|nr:hypothetical protein ACN38_g6053 [Penicillium nordicum]
MDCSPVPTTLVEMDSATQEPHGLLKRLSQQPKAFEPSHPSQMTFRGLESKYPKSRRLLQKYPVNPDPEENEKPPRLRLVPTFDEILEDC